MSTGHVTLTEVRPKKYFNRFKEPLAPLPDLVEAQLDSFKWLVEKGLAEVFKEFSPIKDYSEKKFELEITGFTLGDAKHDEYYAKDNKLAYEAPIKMTVRLKNKTLGSAKEQEIFMADFPLMTSHGTFIISGVERVIVPQLARSFGVFFTATELKDKRYFGAKIIPSRGVWIEIETEADGAVYVRIDRKRKFPVTSLLRVLSGGTDKDILKAFDKSKARMFIEASFAKDHAKTIDESYIEIHKRLRDGEIGSVDNAKEFINSIFNPGRYDLSKVGRFKLNKRFGLPLDEKSLERRTVSFDEFVRILDHVANLNTTPGALEDDIDHLGSRRVRF